MLRFNLGKIPVTIHGSHLMIALLFGYSWSTLPAVRLPLTNTGAIAPEVSNYVLLAVWVAIISGSILVHELGHALSAAGFGHQPSIHLAWLGGHTEHGMPADIAWYKRFTVILAGPVAGALLGVVAGILFLMVPLPPVAAYAMAGIAFANFWWALLNLLPVNPLDGSQLVMTLSLRFFGKRGFLIANVIGVVVGVAVVAYAVNAGQPFLAIIVGMGAFEGFRNASAYLRGEVGGGTIPQGALEALTLSKKAFEAGELETAERHARAVLEVEGSTVLHARVHYLLGWIALRRKQGQAALDEFAQAGKTSVEPEALATAFGLIGDHTRAASLWELAYRERRSPKTGEAWAASLLLTGQRDAAARVPGIDLASAELLAARSAFEQRDFRRAAELAKSSLERQPSNEAAYDAACGYAHLGELDTAMAMLEKARALGYSDLEHAANDPDLTPLRGHPEFVRWLSHPAESRPH